MRCMRRMERMQRWRRMYSALECRWRRSWDGGGRKWQATQAGVPPRSIAGAELIGHGGEARVQRRDWEDKGMRGRRGSRTDRIEKIKTKRFFHLWMAVVDNFFEI